MVIADTLLFIAMPERSKQNIFFRTKIVMLLCGHVIWISKSCVYRRVAPWDVANVPPSASPVDGALNIVLRVCIVLAVCMTAYNWFECDRQPQLHIINFPTSRVPT